MPSALKIVIQPNSTHVGGWEVEEEASWCYREPPHPGVIRVYVRPSKRHQRLCLCPESECRRECPRDGYRHKGPSTWCAPSLNGAPILIERRPPARQVPLARGAQRMDALGRRGEQVHRRLQRRDRLTGL